MYSDSSSCSTDKSKYTDTTATSFNQTTQANNGKYICLYAEDSL
jgi:hypothetical protein